MDTALSARLNIFTFCLQAVADYRTDAQLHSACGQQVQNLCADVDAGNGNEIDCLEKKRMQVSWDCLNQISRMQQENGDDIRLSTKLFSKCLADSQKFCKDVQPGHMRVQVRGSKAIRCVLSQLCVPADQSYASHSCSSVCQIRVSWEGRSDMIAAGSGDCCFSTQHAILAVLEPYAIAHAAAPRHSEPHTADPAAAFCMCYYCTPATHFSAYTLPAHASTTRPVQPLPSYTPTPPFMLAAPDILTPTPPPISSHCSPVAPCPSPHHRSALRTTWTSQASALGASRSWRTRSRAA